MKEKSDNVDTSVYDECTEGELRIVLANFEYANSVLLKQADEANDKLTATLKEVDRLQGQLQNLSTEVLLLKNLIEVLAGEPVDSLIKNETDPKDDTDD